MKEVVAIVLVLIAVYAFAPKIWSQGEALVRDHLSWTEEAKRKDPVGYLRYAQGRLEDTLAKMDDIASKLEGRIKRLEKEAQKDTREEGQYQKLLNRGKEVYAGAEKSSRYPVEFVGASYKRAELVAQLRILFDRNAQTKGQIERMKKAHENAMKWLGEIYEKRAQARNELAALKTTIVIAEAYAAATEVERMIRHIGEVTENFDAYIGDVESTKLPLRDADDLLRHEYRGASEEEFQKFLNLG
jgi:hypothetical protein